MLPLLVGVYAKLTSVQTAGSFYALLGGRIRLLRAKQDETTPLCVVIPTAHNPQRYFDNEGDDVELLFDTVLYGDRETAAQPFPPESLVAIQDKLIDLLDRETVTATGYGNAQVWGLQLGSLSVEDTAWAITSSWKLTATPN